MLNPGFESLLWLGGESNLDKVTVSKIKEIARGTLLGSP